jgi:hypothetical protein
MSYDGQPFAKILCCSLREDRTHRGIGGRLSRCARGAGKMQERRFGSIGDFVKLAFLRHLQDGRHLAVCWYLTGQGQIAHLQKSILPT